MAAADHLSPRLFHSTNADLAPGDLIHPGYKGAGARLSDDYDHIGHSDFAWASKYKPKTSFGKKNHYEVEPTGLTEDYKVHETPGGVMTRMDSPGAEERSRPADVHRHNVVSLAPLKVKQQVTRHGEPLKGDK